MKSIFVSCIISVFFFIPGLYAQIPSQDSVRFQYDKIYASCLDGDVQSALLLLAFDTVKKISVTDRTFKSELESRFKFKEDKSNYLTSKKSGIDDLLKIFHAYWCISLLNKDKNNDTILIRQLGNFFKLKTSASKTQLVSTDSIDSYLKKYIQNKGLHSNGFGKTGRLFDLLVWQTEQDTVYTFTLQEQKISAKVILMDNFITLGWEEYATLGKYYPGGWATTEALYCVQKAYDLKSERFLISYIAHESRHFADYKLFPRLTSADLEYRAKLTELAMADNSLYTLIRFFINNANYDSDNGHSIANYCVIRDLSTSLFNVAFETDIHKWQNIGINSIHKVAYELLETNTTCMQQKGSELEKYIKQ